MEIVALEIFPVPIYYVSNFLNEKQICLAKEFIKKSETLNAIHPAIINGSSSHPLIKEFNILTELSKLHSEWISVCNNLINILNDYSNYSCIEFNKLTDSWFNIQDELSILKYHNHLPGSYISGAIYLNVDSNSSPIVFRDSFDSRFSIKYKDINRFSTPSYKFCPKVGDLIIFPSYLSHGSDEINFYNGRTVISFNTL